MNLAEIAAQNQPIALKAKGQFFGQLFAAIAELRVYK
jgi:hypothetical protein